MSKFKIGDKVRVVGWKPGHRKGVVISAPGFCHDPEPGFVWVNWFTQDNDLFDFLAHEESECDLEFDNGDHGNDIAKLRITAERVRTSNDGNSWGTAPRESAYLLSADLLEMHDRKSISLDNWQSAKDFIEPLIGHEIIENGE